MSKMKSKSSITKRFKVTASGKVKIKKANLRHILTKKPRNLKRDKRKAGYLNAKDGSNIIKAAPSLLK